MSRRLSRRTLAMTGLALLGGCALVSLAGGCNRRGEAANAPARPPPAVVVAPAVARDVPVYLDEIGRTAPSELVYLTPQVAGKVIARPFDDGADVKKGQILFEIDPRPFQADLDAAKGELAQNVAMRAFNTQELNRTADLLKTDAAAQHEYDQMVSNLAVTEGKAKANQAAIERATLNLEYCTIRSPVDGRVGQRLVDVGNVVKANETQLVVVQRIVPVYADFTTAERNLPAVRQHMKAGTLKVEVRVPNDPTGPREGELSFLDTAVQQGAGTIKLRATLKNEDRHLWAGQFVNVRLVLEVKKDAVLVPSQAVQVSQAGPFVYVVKEDPKAGPTAELRPVTAGQRQGDMVVVEKGVAAGETVVTVGQMAVTPGGPVKVETGMPGAQAAGPQTAPTTQAVGR